MKTASSWVLLFASSGVTSALYLSVGLFTLIPSLTCSGSTFHFAAFLLSHMFCVFPPPFGLIEYFLASSFIFSTGFSIISFCSLVSVVLAPVIPVHTLHEPQSGQLTSRPCTGDRRPPHACDDRRPPHACVSQARSL